MANIINMIEGGLLFVGDLPHLGPHTSISSTAVIGLDEPVVKRVVGENQWLQARCFVSDGRLHHETILTGTVGILFADPGGRLNGLLKRETAGRLLVANPTWTDEFLRTCREIRDAHDPDSYGEILERGFPAGFQSWNRLIAGDERLERVLREMALSPGESPEVLARKIGMSSSWVQHRFKQAVGLPVATSRKWFRVRAAALALRRGSSLADAALAGGFYDQSHFTNVFRGIFGIPPHLAFSGEQFEWYIHDQGRRILIPD